MTQHLTTEYRGYTLHYHQEGDKWSGGPDGMPGGYGTLAELTQAIDVWEVECQKLNGVKVWDIDHDNPKYWQKRDAVFRSGGDHPGYYSAPTHVVEMRNGNVGRPESLYGRARGFIALDNDEAQAAIDKAKAAYQKLIKANEAWRKAKNAIPTMTAEQWAQLPEKPAKLGRM